MFDLEFLVFQSHAGSIEALRFQGVSGGREREPPSEIRFSLNIASIVRFVKGCGLLHGSGDDGGPRKPFPKHGIRSLWGDLFGSKGKRMVGDGGRREGFEGIIL